MYKDCKTLVDVLYEVKKEYGDNPFLKYRKDGEFIEITFNKFVSRVERMAAALYDIGIRKDDKVGIISENMYKWLIVDMALISLGAVDVPRGSDSTTIEISYILKHSEAKYCFVENPEQADKIISIKKELPKIKHIILLNGLKKDIKEKIPPGIKILDYEGLLYEGKKVFSKHEKKLIESRKNIKEDDIATIIYTSGTTGQPKGVMLLHKNIMHNVRCLPDIIDITVGAERWLSILPVWHVFERTIEYIIMATAGMMAYSKPTAKHLLPDFEEIKPTCMVSVPRIWEALYQGIYNKVKRDSKIKFFLFRFFVKIGGWYTSAKKVLKNKIALFKKPFFISSLIRKLGAIFVIWHIWLLNILGNILIFNTIKKKTGGFLRVPISGGGALPEYVDKFFCAVGVEILEGWGLTETAPVIGVRTFETLIPNTVGPPAPGVEIMIGDENWKPLQNQSEKGIVYVRGENVMAGYFKQPEKTKNVINEEGWFNTGDLGRMTITGQLQLTGRAKDTIVLVGGENIEPGPIEDKILEHPLVHQIMIVGQDKKVLGALIVPSEENLTEYANKREISFNKYEDLLNNDIILDEFKQIIKSKINTKNGFRDYERITFISLLKEPFEIGKELTHSLKMKRNVISEKYEKLINKMFP